MYFTRRGLTVTPSQPIVGSRLRLVAACSFMIAASACAFDTSQDAAHAGPLRADAESGGFGMDLRGKSLPRTVTFSGIPLCAEESFEMKLRAVTLSQPTNMLRATYFRTATWADSLESSVFGVLLGEPGAFKTGNMTGPFVLVGENDGRVEVPECDRNELGDSHLELAFVFDVTAGGFDTDSYTLEYEDAAGAVHSLVVPWSMTADT